MHSWSATRFDSFTVFKRKRLGQCNRWFVRLVGLKPQQPTLCGCHVLAALAPDVLHHVTFAHLCEDVADVMATGIFGQYERTEINDTLELAD
jgi:hypothetical protein